MSLHVIRQNENDLPSHRTRQDADLEMIGAAPVQRQPLREQRYVLYEISYLIGRFQFTFSSLDEWNQAQAFPVERNVEKCII